MQLNAIDYRWTAMLWLWYPTFKSVEVSRSVIGDSKPNRTRTNQREGRSYQYFRCASQYHSNSEKLTSFYAFLTTFPLMKTPDKHLWGIEIIIRYEYHFSCTSCVSCVFIPFWPRFIHFIRYTNIILSTPSEYQGRPKSLYFRTTFALVLRYFICADPAPSR
jgi:hypothetical protein